MKRERIVSIRALVKRILEKWRGILLLGLIMAVAAAGYKAVGLRSLLQNRAEEAAAQEEQAAQVQEVSQEPEISALDELGLLDNTYKNRNAYVSESLLFRINPDAEGRASFLLRVEVPEEADTGEQSLGVSVYAPKKGSYKDGQIVYVGSQDQQEALLIKSYLNFITEGIDWTALAEEFHTRPQYLQELVLTEEYTGLSGARITAICEDVEGAQKILDHVEAEVRKYTEQLTRDQGNHSLLISEKKAGVYVDSEMESWVVNEIYNVNTLYTYRTTLARSAGTGSSSGGSSNAVPVSTIAKVLVKYAVFGFALGVILFVGIYTILLLAGGVVLSGKEFNTQYGIRKLAVLPAKTRKNPIDRLIAGIEKGYQTSPDRKECYNAAVANVRAQLAGQGTVAVISDLPMETVNGVTARLNAAAKGSGVYFAGADIGHSAEGINTLAGADGAVIVAQSGRSRYGDTGDILEILQGTGRELLGSIVI